MGHKTPLYAQHQAMGGKLVDFGGWDMPLHYGSQLEEHNKVRQASGMFDVSHMTIVDVSGQQARSYLRHLVANDVARLQMKGKALYTAMLNEKGGILDDLIIYLMTEPGSSNEWYRLVVNCATREKDLAWMAHQAVGFDVTLTEQPELAMVAIQGPEAIAKAGEVLGASRKAMIDELAVFQGVESEGWFIARTGYTGEDGLEIMVPEEQVADFWVALADAGVAPCGLGARDTLRLEAGMNLYGSDMTKRFHRLSLVLPGLWLLNQLIVTLSVALHWKLKKLRVTTLSWWVWFLRLAAFCVAISVLLLMVLAKVRSLVVPSLQH